MVRAWIGLNVNYQQFAFRAWPEVADQPTNLALKSVTETGTGDLARALIGSLVGRWVRGDSRGRFPLRLQRNVQAKYTKQLH